MILHVMAEGLTDELAHGAALLAHHVLHLLCHLRQQGEGDRLGVPVDEPIGKWTLPSIPCRCSTKEGEDFQGLPVCIVFVLTYTIPMPSDGVTSESASVLDFVQSGPP